jgi:hypothetical protein
MLVLRPKRKKVKVSSLPKPWNSGFFIIRYRNKALQAASCYPSKCGFAHIICPPD